MGGTPPPRSALDPQGAGATEIAAVWWIMLGLGVVVLAVVGVALFVGLRRDGRPDEPSTSNRWLIGGGVVMPAVVVAVVLGVTLVAMGSDTPERPALTIEVTGHQWWWEVGYPDHGVVTANEVHIPVGEPVELRLRSADVIHSFWVPALAGKMDLLPERVNTLTIDATEPGRYRGKCAEFCGVQHANMDFTVVAHEPADFEAWLDGQRSPAAPPPDDSAAAVRGAATFLAEGCASCHTIAGTEAAGDAGPDLTHVMSRERIAGGMLDATVPDLRTWIADPHAVKEGVLMPATPLTDAEIDDLVAYLETLR